MIFLTGCALFILFLVLGEKWMGFLGACFAIWWGKIYDQVIDTEYATQSDKGAR